MLYCVDPDTTFVVIYLRLRQHILGFIWPFGQYMVKEGSLWKDAELPAHVAASAYRQAPLYAKETVCFWSELFL